MKDIQQMNGILKKLYRNLKKEFPPYHHNHIQAFTAFWNLVDRVYEQDKETFLKLLK